MKCTRREWLGLGLGACAEKDPAGSAPSRAAREVPVVAEPVTLETTHRRKDGSTYPARVRLTLTEVAGDKSSTIVFPLPMDLIEPLLKKLNA